MDINIEKPDHYYDLMSDQEFLKIKKDYQIGDVVSFFNKIIDITYIKTNGDSTNQEVTCWDGYPAGELYDIIVNQNLVSGTINAHKINTLGKLLTYINEESARSMQLKHLLEQHYLSLKLDSSKGKINQPGGLGPNKILKNGDQLINNTRMMIEKVNFKLYILLSFTRFFNKGKLHESLNNYYTKGQGMYHFV